MNNSTLRARKFKPQRFPSGLSTDLPTSRLGNFGMPDPTSHAVFFDDFTRASTIAGDFTKTNNTGTGTAAKISGMNGILKLLTTAGAADDVTYVKTTGDFIFQPDSIGPPHVAAERVWFACRFQLDDASLPNFVAGLIIDSNTNPLAAVTEGIYFKKASGAATVDFIATKTSGGAGTSTLAAVATLAANTWVELAFCYDPYQVNVNGSPGAVLWYLNGVPQGSVPVTNVPASTINVTPILQIKNSTGVARFALVDYVFAAQERRE